MSLCKSLANNGFHQLALDWALLVSLLSIPVFVIVSGICNSTPVFVILFGICNSIPVFVIIFYNSYVCSVRNKDQKLIGLYLKIGYFKLLITVPVKMYRKFG